ncbi:MAG: TonB-dependent receptor plug domain-containing protein, partial [Phycisphaerales bacterium]|nr:TonB-dependent receptor plug domain-containing protein [Phycisphaerales bacterium]
GGADFQRFSILPEDIERIEVVRGPGGAVWGANAFNGVVNVIRKDPRDQGGFMSSTTVNEFGDHSAYLRVGAGDEKFGWRLSAQYDDLETSEDAINNDTIFSRDFSRNTRVDWQAGYSLDESTEMVFGVSFADIERGDFEFVGYQPGRDEEIQTTRFNFKLDHEIDSESSFMVQAYGLYEDVTRPSVWRHRSSDLNVDGQYSFTPGQGHTASVGASLRFSFYDFDLQDTFFSVRELKGEEQWAGFYFVDRWQINDRNSLETQARVDWYSGTQTDWSGRMSWIRSLDEEGDHTLRFSIAKAFRAQQVSIRELGAVRLPLPNPPFLPGSFGFSLFPAGDLDNEQIYSGEVGYYGRLSDEVTIRVDGFYNYYQDLVGVLTVPDPTAQGLLANTLANAFGGEAYGFEAEITHTTEKVTVSGWYGFNHFDFTDRLDPDPNIRGYRPTEQNAGVRGRVELMEDHTVSMNYRYTGEGEPDGFGDGDWPERHRVDLTWAMDVFDGRGEIMIGVSDVFDETSIVVSPVGTLFLNSFETPGRSFFGRVQVEF